MPLDLARVQAICFDVDGTLSDTDDAWTNRLVRMFRGVRFLFRHRDPTSFARWLIMTGESPANSIYHLLDHLSLDDNVARLYEWLVRRKQPVKSNFILMEHARELLEYAIQRYPLAIVSARNEESTLRFVNQFGLHPFFKGVITSLTCDHTKPYPDPVLYAARLMQVQPEACLMVGDTTVDILAGRSAGAQTVGVLCGFGTEKELRRAGADLIVRNLGELEKVLEDLPLNSLDQEKAVSPVTS